MHDTARAWVEDAWGRPVREVTALAGGWTSTMLGLTAEDGARAVVRLMTRDPWRRHAPQLLARESAVQTLLAGTPVPAPTSVAVDATGELAGDPAHLMTLLPGRTELLRADDELLDRLARLLADVHAVEPGPARPRDYQSWAWPEKRVVPAWATRPGPWEEAFAVLAEEPPPYDAAFLHRDFHLGNVLWHDGEVTGLVDWVETSWGPAALDVAHARTYLAMLHGGDAADRFGQAYDALRPGARTGARYWDVLDVVGYLPDPAKVVQPWRDQGLAIVDGTARIRLGEHLAAVLDG
ncbi:MAG: phosphotransferase family protein [Nocardioidaceae bacterium]